MSLVVYDASMSDLQHRNDSAGIVDLVNNPVISGPDAPCAIPFQFPAARWSWIVSKRRNLCFDRFVKRGIKLQQLFFGQRKNAEEITHLRFRSRSILAMASSNGTAVSPEAFASSYSRTAWRSSSSSRSSSYSLISSTTATRTPFSSVTNCLALGIFLTLGRVYSRANRASRQRLLKERERHSSSPGEVTFRTARNASCGMSTWPTRFMRFLPSFCFSRSLRLRVMSPP